MPFLLTYLIKFSVAIAIFYCMYRFALRPLTFYKWNRYYLCGYGLLSLLLPFINIDFLLPGGDESVITSIPSINNVGLDQLSAYGHDRYLMMDYSTILVSVFALGATYVITRVIGQYRSLLTIRKSAVLIDSEDAELYDVSADISPFSFNNSIYFNSRLHPTDELAKILQHEFVHVKQKHTIDLFIAEFLCIINWFNPFVWLLRKSIRQNLEFIADQQVLESGVDAKQYQYLLLKVTGITPLGLTSHFNISSLKKRIAMMNKMRTAKVHLLKFLFVLPLLSVVLVSFRNATESTKELNVISKLDHLTRNEFLIFDTTPPPPPPRRMAPPPPPGQLIPPPPPSKLVRHSRLAAKDLPADVRSITVSEKLTVNRKDGKTEVYDLSSPDDMKAYKKKYGKMVPPPPPPMPPAGVSHDDRSSLYYPSELKGVNVVLNSGDPVLKNGGKPSGSPSSSGANGHDLKGTDPLYVLDGKVLPPGTDLDNVISPDNMESINVLKDASASALYGDKAINGVVLIVSKTGTNSTTKSAEGRRDAPVTIRLKSADLARRNEQVTSLNGDTMQYKKDISKFTAKDFEGLILLDGKEISREDLQKMNPQTFKGITVIKGAASNAKYGKKGEEGVVEIISN